MLATLDTLPPPPADDYAAFIERKSQLGGEYGFRPTFFPDLAMGFQSALIEWAVSRGRGAVLAGTGLGKTLIQLAVAENVVRHENKPYLIATPLAVCRQTVNEAGKFGMEARRSKDGKAGGPGIVVTNYERLHLFDPADFCGMGLDESGGIKDFDAKRTADVTNFMRKMKYRHLYSAVPAPNDYVELGTSAEALGELGYQDMLTRFFKKENQKDHLGWGRQIYRFRGHAERQFWRWVCSWARACRKPSDLGFDDGPFVLPPLETRQHLVKSDKTPEGFLPGFIPPAVGLIDQRAERRRTLEERCGKAAELVNGTGQPFVCWCGLNPEGDLLDKLVPDAVQVSGRDSDDAKEEAFEAFAAGKVRGIVTKPEIGAWGLNWQHCAHTVVFPSHSFERYYQLVRRFWRFGQTRPVVVDVVTGEGEANVLGNLNCKQEAAEGMFDKLVSLMGEQLRIDRRRADFKQKIEVPEWLA